MNEHIANQIENVENQIENVENQIEDLRREGDPEYAYVQALKDHANARRDLIGFIADDDVDELGPADWADKLDQLNAKLQSAVSDIQDALERGVVLRNKEWFRTGDIRPIRRRPNFVRYNRRYSPDED